MKKTKQLILDSLKKEETCFKDLIDKIGEQKKAIEDKDEVRVLAIIEEKNGAGVTNFYSVGRYFG